MADPFATLSGNSPTRTVDIRVYFLVAVALLGLALWLTKKYWYDRPPPKNKQSTFYVPLSTIAGHPGVVYHLVVMVWKILNYQTGRRHACNPEWTSCS